jgi:hypothetical protein
VEGVCLGVFSAEWKLGILTRVKVAGGVWIVLIVKEPVDEGMG